MRAPFFAGGVRSVQQEDVSYVRETVDASHEWNYDDKFFDDIPEVNVEDFDDETTGPPSLSEAQLAELDEAADWEEVLNLQRMGVFEDLEQCNLPENYRYIDCTEVRDWRFRRECWRRRTRIVTRDYKKCDPGREGLFSASSTATTNRLLVSIQLTEDKEMWNLDVNNAYLLCDQIGFVAVKAPHAYVKKYPKVKYWRLLKILPGQREGSIEWNKKLRKLLLVEGLQVLKTDASMYYDPKEKNIALSHVDDLQILCTKGKGKDLITPFTKDLKCTVGGPPGDTFVFLKRIHVYRVHREGLFDPSC